MDIKSFSCKYCILAHDWQANEEQQITESEDYDIYDLRKFFFQNVQNTDNLLPPTSSQTAPNLSALFGSILSFINIFVVF